MVEQDGPPPGPEAAGPQAADRLALALEDVGFDVGRAFPRLGSGVDSSGAPVVELGSIAVAVAAELAAVLSHAARQGAVVPGERD